MGVIKSFSRKPDSGKKSVKYSRKDSKVNLTRVSPKEIEANRRKAYPYLF